MMNVLNIGPKWKALLVAALACTLCQCSNKEGKEKDFSVRMTTKNPLIRTTERKIGTTTIQPNWFDLAFKVQNKTNEAVRIEEMLIYYSVDGVEAGPVTFDLSIIQVQDISTGVTYDYVNYCTYPANDNIERDFSACLNSATSVADTTFAGPAKRVQKLNMYIGGLTDLPTDSKVYVMRVELIGVFIDSGEVETDRFVKRFNFTTR